MGRKRKNEIIKKSNALIRSHWTITSIWEPRLVGVLASKVRVEDEDFKTYRIPIGELIEGTGQKKSGRLYEEIVNSVKKMLRYPIELRGDDGSTTLCNIFSQCKIIPAEGVIELSFAEALKPHYLQLKERFTQYSLEEFMRLPSIYSQRLFEVLSSWRNVKDGEVTISMDELHEQLDTPISFRKDFKAFRIRVLEQAHRDIMANPDSSLDYEWEAVKKPGGRKVVAVRFIFDRCKVAAEREKKQQEEEKLQSKRNNEIFKQSWKCHQERSALSSEEQSRMDLHPDPEVCEYCRKSNLPIPRCQKVKHGIDKGGLPGKETTAPISTQS